MFEELSNMQKLGVTGTLPILAFVFYQLWRLWKQDNKGDQIDARIQAYSNSLQTQADKLGAVIDQLRKENEVLIKTNATLEARVIVLQAEKEGLIVRLTHALGVKT